MNLAKGALEWFILQNKINVCWKRKYFNAENFLLLCKGDLKKNRVITVYRTDELVKVT